MMKLNPTTYATQVLWAIQNQHGPSLATGLDLTDRADDLFNSLNPQDRTLDIVSRLTSCLVTTVGPVS